MGDIKFESRRVYWCMLIALLLAFSAPSLAAAGAGDIVNCTAPLNISDSPGYASADPLVLGDSAGGAHLFWAERVQGQPNAVPNVPDTLMYSHYDGQDWSSPIDIFLSPRDAFNRQINGIRGLLDEHGTIHLIWMGPDYRLYYSSAPATAAGSAHGWQRPRLLARDHTGVQYSADIAVTSPNTLHILYGSGTGGGVLDDNRTNRAVTYIRSNDGGDSWSNPVDIYTFGSPANGASNIRLLAAPNDRLYASWTEWDPTGNGQAIYFARSLDNGRTWEEPTVLDRRIGDEYERDWTNLAVLGGDQVVTMWEGGFRAYPQAQYSQDAGQSWSKPIDTFYWLIADNGPAQFVRDSADRLHVFLVRRLREGFIDRCDYYPRCRDWPTNNTLWHSIWEGEASWREPRPVGDFMEPNIGANYASVAVGQGNQVFAAWSGTGEQEVILMQCQLEDTPAAAIVPWSTPTPKPIATATQPVLSPTPTRAPMIALPDNPAETESHSLSSGTLIALGLGPALLLLALVVFGQRYLLRQRRSS